MPSLETLNEESADDAAASALVASALVAQPKNDLPSFVAGTDLPVEENASLTVSEPVRFNAWAYTSEPSWNTTLTVCASWR